MMSLLRAEFRKLLTIRSTYILSGIALVLVAFIAFYPQGYKGTGINPYWLSDVTTGVSMTIAVFTAIIAILLMGHEYRYNTVIYTLTSANSRTKVLLAKIGAVVGLSVVLTSIVTAVAVFAYWLGVTLSPNVARIFITPEFFWSDIWQAYFFVVANGLIGLLFALIFRHLVGAIAALFILPTIEALLGVVLKDNVKYLPNSALDQVHAGSLWSPGSAALLFTAYLAVAWLITWFLFLKRDAN
jgi:ABC-type transport system involved in multi-copper enzyme maturation permease subunit